MPERVDSIADPKIGLMIVGSYVIRDKIAEGGMGAVYVAVNDLGQKKVVKFLLAEYSRNQAIRERFLREAHAAARLAGKPHIVKVDDIGSLPDGQQFMTMEFLHGRTLESHLRSSGRLTPHHAFRLVVQIARGLHELHQAGIIHRDLKPGNIFLTTKDDDPYHVVLIDLGIAHDSLAVQEAADFRTQTGAAMGTPGYMAVEQYGNAGNVTPAADLYALGVILWEMLVGSRPWGDHDPRVLYHLQMTERPVLPPDVAMPEEWKPVLLSTLAPDVRDRPPSIYAFLAALASHLPGDHRMNVMSGAEMMARHAKSLINNAPPEVETVRAPNAHRLGPMLWNPSGATQPAPAAPAAFGDAQAMIPHPATPPMVATVNERPAPAASPPGSASPTTLGGSAGVTTPPLAPTPTRRRWGFAAVLVLIGATVAIGTVFVLGRVRSGSEPAAGGASLVPARATAVDAGTVVMHRAVDASVPRSVAVTPADAAVPVQTATSPTAKDGGAKASKRVAPVHRLEATSHHGTSKPSTSPAKKPRSGEPAHDTFDPNAVEE